MAHATAVLAAIQRPNPARPELRPWEVAVRETELNHLIRVRSAAERLVAWDEMGVDEGQRQAAYDALREMVRYG